MKLGLTTNVFAGPIKNQEVDLAKILELARGHGMRSVEIRDDGASLRDESVRTLRSVADGMGLGLSYAIRNEMSAGEDRVLFERGAKLASILGDKSVLRVLGAQEFLKPVGKLGYVPDEGTKIVNIVEEYGRIASKLGVVVAMENAREPLYGDGTCWGMAELIREIKSENVGLTFDPANATSRSLCKVPAIEADVLRFASEFGERIFLVHYKTTLGGEVQPALGEGDVRSETLFESLQTAFSGTFCIEIPGSPGLAETRLNFEKSVGYLRQDSLARFFQ